MRKLNKKVLSFLLVLSALPLMASYAGLANPLPNGVFLQGITSAGAVQRLLGINAATGNTVIDSVTGSSILFQRNAVTMWSSNPTGDLTGETTNSGNIVIQRTLKGNSQTSTTGITAAGTNLATCTGLSRVYNLVNTVAAGTGVCLWGPDYSGIMVSVQNAGANDLKLYPGAAGGAINGAGAGNGITLVAATLEVAMCWHRGSNNWTCIVGPGKSA